ncbi:hypothetical protein [Sphingobium sp. WCS2017Hpa-17]|uniref:hypothetical protein n=1 Tax=Sphingobium sp. WCS2017Hpa-17 TaxID=3073638 RepID=UPI002889FA32|nr:hypothetical protein [Sphingobium sp. WCS2017Hpa-17]
MPDTILTHIKTATGVRGDMGNLADIDRLYDAVQQRHRQIDVVFTNARGGEFAPLGRIWSSSFGQDDTACWRHWARRATWRSPTTSPSRS